MAPRKVYCDLKGSGYTLVWTLPVSLSLRCSLSVNPNSFSVLPGNFSVLPGNISVPSRQYIRSFPPFSIPP